MLLNFEVKQCHNFIISNVQVKIWYPYASFLCTHAHTHTHTYRRHINVVVAQKTNLTFILLIYFFDALNGLEFYRIIDAMKWRGLCLILYFYCIYLATIHTSKFRRMDCSAGTLFVKPMLFLSTKNIVRYKLKTKPELKKKM